MLGFTLTACDPPSAEVDERDLRGVFDDAGAKSARAVPSGRPAARADATTSPSAAPSAPFRERDPGEANCVEERGAPTPVLRTIGRPACRGAEVIEWRDPSGAPRYACVYAPSEPSKRGPLPLVVYFHGSSPGLDDPMSLPKLTSLRQKMDAADISRDPDRQGFIVLGVQGRALPGGKGAIVGAGFDASHASPDNLDKIATDYFVDTLVARKIVDEKRIYALGMGKGAEMAATYAMLRADRVAAFAAYAPSVPGAKWKCPTPPPPGLVLYRACDAVSPCDAVETWLRARDGTSAETTSVRLGDDNRPEPNCAVKSKCSKKKGEALHFRWPKGREKDVLDFFAAHALK